MWPSVILPDEKRVEVDDSAQAMFLDPGEPLLSLGALRTWSGDFFEECCKAATGGVRYTTDSRLDYCPDIGLGSAGFIESKSVGKSGSMILYRCRLKKDIDFSAAAPLAYWLWRHKFSVNEKPITKNQLRDGLAESCIECCLVPLEIITSAAMRRTPRVVNTAFTKEGAPLGYGKGDYGYGWTIPYLDIEARTARVRDLSLTVYGRTVNVTLKASPGVRRILNGMET